MEEKSKSKVVVALTGASGSLFGVEFLRQYRGEKYLVCSRWGKSVLAQETGMTIDQLAPLVTKVFSNEDMSSPLASGANHFDAMVLLPCTATTLSKISYGIADSLITRVAQVALKEKRRLIVCLRETPLSDILLENMLRLSKAGAEIMPISPSFYQGARSVEDLASLFSERVIQLLEPGVPTSGWKTEAL